MSNSRARNRIVAAKAVNPVTSYFDEAARKIRELCDEIFSAARMSVDRAIEIGGLLVGVKERLEHGQWLPWLASNTQLSPKTAQRYMYYFDKRDWVKNVTLTNLTELDYTLRTLDSEADEVAAIEAAEAAEAAAEPSDKLPAKTSATTGSDTGAQQPAPPQTGRKPVSRIMAEISSKAIEHGLNREQRKIEKRLRETADEISETVGQIGRQDHCAWPAFADGLITHGKALVDLGKALIQQGQRLTNDK